MVAELRQHGTGDLPWLERIDRFLELGDEPPSCSLAQVAALRRRNGVRGLSFCHVLELCATCDLRAQLLNAGTHRRAVSRRDDTRQIEHADRRASRTIERGL